MNKRDQLDKRLSKLSLEKKKLLEERLKGKSISGKSSDTIRPRSEKGAPLLSFAQQRLWFLDRFEEASQGYNVTEAYRIQGALDTEILKRCFHEILRRHEVLRTTFTTDDKGNPFQTIHPEIKPFFSIQNIDYTHQDGVEEEIQRIIDREAGERFDLTIGPVLRVTLLTISHEEHVLIVVMHHIVSDEWSIQILHNELSALYEAYSKGQTSPLPDLPIQYADYALWQRDRLTGEIMEKQSAYWKKQLANLPTLDMATDRPRPSKVTYNGAVESLEIPKQPTEALKRVGNETGATLFMTLLAGFGILLSRYTGQDDIVTGSPIANRTRREIAPLIGFFVNTLVLRMDLTGNPTVRELLNRVKRTALDAYANQDTPFERLVEDLQPVRDMSRNPLVQVSFVLQDTRTAGQKLSGLHLEPLPLGNVTVRFDMEFHLREEKGCIRGMIVYNRDLFTGNTIHRMAGHFRNLIEDMVENPDKHLSELKMLSESERHRLVVEMNDTATAYPDVTIHELFESVVNNSPDKVALTCKGETLTYNDLNERANQLVRCLRANGLKPGTPAGLFMDRSIQMVIAILAILKAGGAYVPLSPTYPKKRLSFMIEDSGINLIVTHKDLHLKLDFISESLILRNLDSEQPQIIQSPFRQNESLSTHTSPLSAAYIMYTSGSTGQPKGVTVTHRGVVRLVRETNYADFGPEETLLMFASVSFDASTFELWGALLNHSRLVIFPEDIPSVEELGEFIRKEGVTTLLLTTGLFRQMVKEQEHNLRHVRQLLAGGDVLSSDHAREILKKSNHLKVINAYGPTENTTLTTCYPMESPEEAGKSVSIGKPVANTTVYILDNTLNIVPPGVPGELYTGGDGLARGYHNRPDLTAERFIPDPFGTPGSRLYRTGDMARYLPDGNIEFMGRKDHQVKIRGFRIEPGEIEVLLAEKPVVKDVIVIVKESQAGDKRLVAYVTVKSEELRERPEETINELRDYLSERVPGYMMPYDFVIVDHIPLTPTGKIDRNALPDPEGAKSGQEEAYVAPSTPVERSLTSIWSEILEIDGIGIYDNFFTLGGHSLQATQVMSRISSAFNLNLPLRSLFEAPTIAGLGGMISKQAANREKTEKIYIPDRSAPLPLSFAQERLWFLYHLFPENAFYNMPWAMEIIGSLDRIALERSIREVVRRHEILRTSFFSREGGPVQTADPTLTVEMPVIDLCDLPEESRWEEAKRLISEESEKLFDLERAPLVRATLLRLSEDKHILLLTLHHIVSDGWSMGVMNREISILYRAFSRGEESPLAELSIQYADFALWQRNRLGGKVLESQLDYWKNQLKALPLLELPADRARPAIATYRGAAEPLSISERVTERLKELSFDAGGSLFMTLLSGFMVLMSRYTGREDIVVGSPIANRTRKEIEPLIGFFVNTLVMRGDLRGAPTFREVLGRIKDITLEAYSNQDIPFEHIVEELRPERDTSRNPLVQVMFALQNAPMESISLEGLTLTPAGGAEIMVRFDMECHFFEVDNALQGMIVYNTDLFDRERIRRMAEHYKNLLENICENPGIDLWNYSVMSEAEKERIVLEWNPGESSYPARCMHEIFESCAEKRPEGTALIYGDQTMTYGELNEMANRLAHHLIGLGVKSETVVGVSMERSPELIVALLGILKAGGVYFPIDPSHPRRRRKEMIRDAVPAVIIKERGDDAFESDWEDDEFAPPFIYTDSYTGGESISPESRENPHSPVCPDNTAYINYTSGSTGPPKGIEIPHRGVLRLLFNTDYIELTQKERIIHASNISFDAATFEIWGALLHGGALVILSKEEALDPRTYRDILESKGVTSLFLTTALFNRMSDEIPDIFRGIRNVLFGGEAVDVSRVKSVMEKGPPERLLHMYGPTEGTTFATRYEVSGAGDTIPIGRPISNTTAYVLDKRLNPVPVGIAGELCIGGDGTARGYLNKPDLTAEKFIPNPFDKKPGSRLYRTGDLVRYLSDSNIEFLGRTDRQVKIRGYRIEPGETEARILLSPAVKDTTVTVREDRPGDKRLTAYITLDPQYKISEQEGALLSSDQVSDWEEIFNDHVYTGEREIEDPLFNITGWNSSYDGSPIAVEEMREWANDIISQVLELKPQRVLEAGCGTGMLLLKIAPHCESYEGWDISEVSLDYIRRQISDHGETFSHVELAKRMAHELDQVKENSLDAVILSSVVQYFPDMDYLVKVIQGSVRAVKPGGFIILADLRNYRLMRAFHTSVEIYRAGPGESVKELKNRIGGRIVGERELFVDPSLFTALKERMEEISHVRIRLQRGGAWNEMTKFRYTAILHISQTGETGNVSHTIDGEGLSVGEIREIVKGNRDACICIKNLVNGRVMEDVASERIVYGQDGPDHVTELRKRVNTNKAGIDPEEVYRICEADSYIADISWSDRGPEYMDVVLVKRDSTEEYVCIPSAAAMKSADIKPPDRFGNHPVLSKWIPRLTEDLKRSLKEVLPDFMVPVSYVVVDEMPLTPTGKIDRNSLPIPEILGTKEAYVSPRTSVEETLADIWFKTLGVEEIGIHDNFFSLGGHSLLATRIISEIREEFSIEIPVRYIFEFPTIEVLAREIEAITGKTGLAQIPPVASANREIGDIPLSFAQERLWFLDRFDGPNSNYNVPMALRLTGNLHITALEQTTNEIVRRHEVLRTTFAQKAGDPIQIIWDSLRIPLPVIDLTGLSEEERGDEVKRWTRKEALTPFDLSKGPLLRTTLLHLSNEEHILLMTMHHIVSDGWSMGILNREIFDLYKAFSMGVGSPLPKLPLQYADFAIWQRNRLSGKELDRQLNYWKNKLTGISPVIELPTDRPRPPIQTYRGGIEWFFLESTILNRLNKLSGQAGTSLFMTLMAAFSVLLYRYSDQEDICLGSPIANRNVKEIEPLIGFFVNTLVFRNNLSGNPSFTEILGRVKQTCLDAYAHQDLPFEKLVEALQPERSQSHNPLFQVMFALHNAPLGEFKLPGLKIRPVEMEKVTEIFDLTLSFIEQDTERGKGLLGVIEYNKDIFDKDSIIRMAGHLRNVIEEILANPYQKIPAIALLTKEERQQILIEWNPAIPAYNEEILVHEIFEKLAKHSPDRPAVITVDKTITYGEINRQADNLAGHLRALGVLPETPVGMALQRGANAIVAIMAILKSGGTYVPLDPTYPKERLAYMMEDTGLKRIVTDTSHISIIETIIPDKTALVNIDKIGTPSTTFHTPITHPDSTAYIIYTSGSTGRPKGVPISHRALTNYCKEIKTLYSLTDNDRILHMTSLNFDVSIEEIFPPLISMATIVIPDAELPTPSELNAIALDKKVTIAIMIPAYWEQLLNYWRNAPEETPKATLRLMSIGGDIMTTGMVDLWRKSIMSSARVLNIYGPTETTIGTTVYEVPAISERIPPYRIPIGRPLPGTTAYIVDRNLNSCPIGVPGEFCIGGKRLSKGYIGRPDLTSERFIPDPFTGEGGGRLYKTGDLARYLPDGNIEFIGRMDYQVKIRGLRIELGEIESILSEHPFIEKAVVIAMEDKKQDRRIIAYITENRDHTTEGKVNIEELKSYLKERLPEYMIPSSIAIIDKVPLTSTGKLDRKALPAIEPLPSKGEYIPPKDDVDRELVNIWEEALDRRPIGIKDNFFDLGGHSLLALKIISLLNDRFGIDVPVTTLFQTPTIEGMGESVRRDDRKQPWSPIVPIRFHKSNQNTSLYDFRCECSLSKEVKNTPFFFVPGVGGNLFYLQSLAKSLGDNCVLYGLQTKGLDGRSEPYRSIEEMAADYIEAIKRVQPEGPYYMGGHSFGGAVAFEMVCRMESKGEEIAALALIDALPPHGMRLLNCKDWDHAMWLFAFANQIGEELGMELDISYDTLIRNEPDKQIEIVYAQMKEKGLLPSDTGMRELKGLIQVFKANNEIEYTPDCKAKADITLYRAEEIHPAVKDDNRLSEIFKSSDLEWKRYTKGKAVNHILPGDHMSILREPHVNTLAKEIVLKVFTKNRQSKIVN